MNLTRKQSMRDSARTLIYYFMCTHCFKTQKIDQGIDRYKLVQIFNTETATFNKLL